jgi:FkbM family methyltransferase
MAESRRIRYALFMTLGLRIVKKTWSVLRNFISRHRKYQGLSKLDKRIEDYVSYNNGFYVELGANDGISQSNTYFFEKRKNWNGILIEPVEHNYLECINNRGPKNYFVSAACVSFDYTKDFVELVYSNLMTTPVGLESDIPSAEIHANRGLKYLRAGESIYTFKAKAMTLNKILRDAGAPNRIDLLSLDVEGAELEVLKGIDHESYRFNYICIECRDIEKMKDFLGMHRYEFLSKLTHHDYLFRDVTLQTSLGVM